MQESHTTPTLECITVGGYLVRPEAITHVVLMIQGGHVVARHPTEYWQNNPSERETRVYFVGGGYARIKEPDASDLLAAIAAPGLRDCAPADLPPTEYSFPASLFAPRPGKPGQLRTMPDKPPQVKASPGRCPTCDSQFQSGGHLAQVQPGKQTKWKPCTDAWHEGKNTRLPGRGLRRLQQRKGEQAK